MEIQKTRRRLDGKSFKGWAAIVLLPIALGVTLYRQSPPPAAPATLPADQFSSGRAMERLKVISAQPRPIGSAGHQAVRNYLVAEMSLLGLDPQVQQTTAVNAQGPSIRAATVANIMGRVRGTSSSKAIMLVAHYDSVPHSFGAGDDGAAVAALLEVARALKASASLKNDVIILLTDGEESGMLGAQAFVNEHPWAKDVGLVCNFEARGSNGPVYLFETSAQNGWLIDEFKNSAPRPFASSLMSDIYETLPNDTDFTVFKRANLQGFNFAFIGGATHYHTRMDHHEQLDERSLQQQGQYALALARHFGNFNLDVPRKNDAIYFDVLGAALVSYPSSWTIPLMLIVYVLFVGITLLGFKRTRLTVRGLALGFFAFLLNAFSVAGVAFLVWWVIAGLDQRYSQVPGGGPYFSALYFAGFNLLIIAVMASLYLWFSSRISLENLLAGTLIWWAIAALAAGLLLPGGSYLFIWPLLFMLVALGMCFRRRPEPSLPVNDLVLLSLFALPAIVLLTGVIYGVTVGLGLSFIGAIATLIALLFGLFLPGLDFLIRRFKWRLPAAFAAMSLALLAGGASARLDQNQPESDSLFYVMNTDGNEARWVSFDREPDAWTAQFFPPGTAKSAISGFVPEAIGEFLNSSAPVASLPAPSVQLVADEISQGVRKVRLHVTSPRNAPIVAIHEENGAEILAASVKSLRQAATGTPHPSGTGSNWSLWYYGFDSEGIDLTLEFKPASSLKLKVMDISYGLPELPGFAARPRPTDVMPTPDGVFYQDATIIGQSHSF